MPRRPSGLTAMSPAERQKRYRENRKRWQVIRWGMDHGLNVAFAAEQICGMARPRAPGAQGLAAAAASAMIQIRIAANKAYEEAREKERDTRDEAEKMIAKALRTERPELHYAERHRLAREMIQRSLDLSRRPAR